MRRGPAHGLRCSLALRAENPYAGLAWALSFARDIPLGGEGFIAFVFDGREVKVYISFTYYSSDSDFLRELHLGPVLREAEAEKVWLWLGCGYGFARVWFGFGCLHLALMSGLSGVLVGDLLSFGKKLGWGLRVGDQLLNFLLLI
jgi:hypothetical protein